jgi:hypothetical protein
LHWTVRVTLVAFPLFLLAAWLDPSRPLRAEQRIARLRDARAADEARLADEAAKAAAHGPLLLDFRRLDFRLPPEAHAAEAVGKGYNRWLPDGIKAYHGREIFIEGYLLPTRMEQGGVRECLILADQNACCFGQMPRFCSYLVARIKGTPVPVQMDRPLVFNGTLHVGDVFEHGYWTALYTLDCTGVAPAMLSQKSRFR